MDDLLNSRGCLGTFALIRHGLTVNNAANRISGSGVDTPLVDAGKIQAVDLGKRLKASGIPHIDHCYGSMLLRSQHTLSIVAMVVGCSSKSFHHELNERCWGEAEGMSHAELDKAFGHTTWPTDRHTWEGKLPGGESYADMDCRVWPFFQAEIQPRLMLGQTILVVGHNGLNKTIRRRLEAKTQEETHSLSTDNCGGWIYTISPAGEAVDWHEIISDN